MPLFVKPQFNNVWAATGTKLTPDNAKISQGWIVEIPPHEYENWSQNRQDALLAHINQVGIPMWDATVEYQAGKSYIQGSTTGNVYRAVTTNTNVNPELDIQGNWVIAFEAQGSALLKSQNLADVPDKALARTNLGIPSTVFYDGRYLQRTSNLSDLSNVASARNNLGLGNSATLNVGTTANTVAAGDDQRITWATPMPRRINAGNGLVGGGDLWADRTISLGTPSTINASSGNSTSPGTHNHILDLQSFFPRGMEPAQGSYVLPGGLILNWGQQSFSGNAAGDPVVFQRPFTRGVYFAGAHGDAAQTVEVEVGQVGNFSATGMRIINSYFTGGRWYPLPGYLFWWAVGV